MTKTQIKYRFISKNMDDNYIVFDDDQMLIDVNSAIIRLINMFCACNPWKKSDAWKTYFYNDDKKCQNEAYGNIKRGYYDDDGEQGFTYTNQYTIQQKISQISAWNHHTLLNSGQYVRFILFSSQQSYIDEIIRKYTGMFYCLALFILFVGLIERTYENYINYNWKS